MKNYPFSNDMKEVYKREREGEKRYTEGIEGIYKKVLVAVPLALALTFTPYKPAVKDKQNYNYPIIEETRAEAGLSELYNILRFRNSAEERKYVNETFLLFVNYLYQDAMKHPEKLKRHDGYVFRDERFKFKFKGREFDVYLALWAIGGKSMSNKEAYIFTLDHHGSLYLRVGVRSRPLRGNIINTSTGNQDARWKKAFDNYYGISIIKDITDETLYYDKKYVTWGDPWNFTIHGTKNVSFSEISIKIADELRKRYDLHQYPVMIHFISDDHS